MRLGALVLSAAFVALPVSALAGDPKAAPGDAKSDPKTDAKLEEAKRLFYEGRELFAKGRYDAAIDRWQKSYDLSRRTLIFESIANAYERLGEHKLAKEALQKWRDVAPDNEVPNLDERLKHLDERIKKDEAEAARKAADQKRREDEIRKNGGKVARPPVSIPGVVTLGAGGLLVIGGVVLDGVAASMRPDPNAVCQKPGTKTLCLDTQKDAIETSNTLAIVGDVLWITGAAAAVAGIVILVVDRPKKEEKRSGTVQLSPAAGGLLLRGTF
jgi:tetratricopeptide (TPR) repeat protein